MSNERVGAIAAISAALLGASLLAGTVTMPVANADDPLAPIVADVTSVRGQTRCPKLVYNPLLEDAAQKYARSENSGDAKPDNYPFRTDAYLGSGDPQLAAIGSAYGRGARTGIIDCSFTEFGVGFIRHDDRSVDVVTIVLGQPGRSDGTPAAVQDPQPVPPTQCPAGSPTPTVPAGQACAQVPAPSNTITVAVTRAGFGKIDVTVTNSATIDASCVYVAAPLSNPLGILPTINKDVAVKAKGAVTLNENAPPPQTTYNLNVLCTGTFNGKEIELGHVSQTVSG